MEFQLTPEQEEFILHSVQSGRFASTEDAIREAVALLEARESELAELRAKIDDGIDDLENGRYTEYTEETLHRMIDDIRREGRELHAAGRKSG